MPNLHYIKESETKCRLYYTEKLDVLENKAVSNIYLEIDIASKEVKMIHDFFHKILISKVMENEFAKLEISKINVSEESFIKEESFANLDEFLQEIVTDMNSKLEIISKQISIIEPKPLNIK